LAKKPPDKVDKQIDKAGLPRGGTFRFDPAFDTDKKGRKIIKKAPVQYGPKKNKVGYVDTKGRIWIKDRAHGAYPDHWDVQENSGKKGHTRVDPHGNILAKVESGILLSTKRQPRDY
jgi:hypothetical protein